VRVLVRGREDRFTVSVDASGALLHRRGWRVETGRAPLRETLAAGLLVLAGHDPELPFLDPMCGAGTIALEACARALDLAPGLARPFAFERWPCFEPAVWDRLRDRALARIRDSLPAPVVARDRDEGALDIARRNATRAGLAAHLQLELAAFGSAPPPLGPGLVLVNPPYGRRLDAGTPPARRARELGDVLRRDYRGWRAGVLLPDARLARSLALPSPETHMLSNGGLRVHLIVGEVPRAAAHAAAQYH
jgi:putative N6-adenine-specific DNA methylase